MKVWFWMPGLKRATEKVWFVQRPPTRTVRSYVTKSHHTTARTWKQPRCPSADEWTRKLWYIYTMEYYLAVKKEFI